eukprot:9462566-Prorocentrum_lima.AAC.1
MAQESFLQALTQQLDHAITPVTTPPGKLVQSASSGHARVDERRAISSTPTQRTPPSPRDWTSTTSPHRE